ncbi:MAG: hypothetical protein AAF266_13285 [Planctomycetota bacterium]
MTREVALTSRAVLDIDSNLAFLAEYSVELARRWCDAADRAIADLENDPERYAIASERELNGIDLRQINFGIGRRLTHRMVFAIRSDRVVVYSVRGLTQRDLTIDDIV